MAQPNVRLVWNQGEYDRVTKGEVIHAYLDGLGQRGVQAARRLCAVSQDGSYGRPPGYLRDSITHEITKQDQGPVLDIFPTATTPDGFSYGAAVESGSVAHVIRSKGPYPLRNRQTGEVFGRIVHHPGTDPKPFLRPALETLRYG